EDAFVTNELGLIGVNHLFRLNKTTFIKSAVGASTNYSEYLQDNLVRNSENLLITKYRAAKSFTRENRYTFRSDIHKKFSASWKLQAGMLIERYDLDFSTADRDNRLSIPDADNDGIPDYFITVREVDGAYTLSQFFAQAEH